MLKKWNTEKLESIAEWTEFWETQKKRSTIIVEQTMTDDDIHHLWEDSNEGRPCWRSRGCILVDDAYYYVDIDEGTGYPIQRLHSWEQYLKQYGVDASEIISYMHLNLCDQVYKGPPKTAGNEARTGSGIVLIESEDGTDSMYLVDTESRVVRDIYRLRKNLNFRGCYYYTFSQNGGDDDLAVILLLGAGIALIRDAIPHAKAMIAKAGNKCVDYYPFCNTLSVDSAV